MRVRPPADITDSVDDTNTDSDAPTQLWSGRLSFASLTPSLRAARRRQKLEALLNTQTGITFEAAAQPLETKPQTDNQTRKNPPSTTPPVVAAAVVPMSMSGPQLALFVAVGVAVGGIAALRLDHFLHPFGQQAQVVNSEQPTAAPTQVLAANAPLEEKVVSAVVESPPVQVTVVPTVVPRQQAAKPRVSADPVPQLNTPASTLALPAKLEQPTAANGEELRIPTQLHPRINPLMTSKQVFRE